MKKIFPAILAVLGLLFLSFIVPVKKKMILVTNEDVVSSNKPFAGFFGGQITINDKTYYGVTGGFSYAFSNKKKLIQHSNVYNYSF